MQLRPQQLKLELFMLGCQIYTARVAFKKLSCHDFFIVHLVHYDTLQLW